MTNPSNLKKLDKTEDIILLSHRDGWIIDKNDADQIHFSSLNDLLLERYSIDLTSSQIRKLKKEIDAGINKNTLMNSIIEISANSINKSFEINIIPILNDLSVILFKKIDGLRLKLEGKEIQLLENGILSNDFKGILKYVTKQNNIDYKPSYSEISDEMHFTDRTGRKKIRALIIFKYLKEIKVGRMKILTITELGKMSLL